jgi:hypothetical protein
MVRCEISEGFDAEGVSGFSHGMCSVNKDQINADLVAFIRE